MAVHFCTHNSPALKGNKNKNDRWIHDAQGIEWKGKLLHCTYCDTEFATNSNTHRPSRPVNKPDSEAA